MTILRDRHEPAFIPTSRSSARRVDEEGALEANLKAVSIINGGEVIEPLRSVIEQRAKDEGRVAILVTPVEYFRTIPIPHRPKG